MTIYEIIKAAISVKQAAKHCGMMWPIWSYGIAGNLASMSARLRQVMANNNGVCMMQAPIFYPNI